MSPKSSFLGGEAQITHPGFLSGLLHVRKKVETMALVAKKGTTSHFFLFRPDE